MVPVNELDCSQRLLADSRASRPDEVGWLSWAILMTARFAVFLGSHWRPQHQDGPLLSGSYIISEKQDRYFKLCSLFFFIRILFIRISKFKFAKCEKYFKNNQRLTF